MNKEAKQLFKVLKEQLDTLIIKNGLQLENINIVTKALKPEEAIGNTKRKDFPILTGKEIMLQAQFKGARGQAFTSAPCNFKGTLQEVMAMDIEEDAYARGLFIAALNAVTCYLGISDHTVHCKDEEPEECSKKVVQYFEENYSGKKIALIGYQPAILERLSEKFDVMILDLNIDNIGQSRYGCVVKDGEHDFDAVVKNWCDVVLCTGSTLCNGTIVNFMSLEKEVLFFGTTLAGTAALLGLKRICPCSV